MIELLIDDGKRVFEPVVTGEVMCESFRRGQAGRLVFGLVESDTNYRVAEGCSVSLKLDGKGVFFGIVFAVKHSKNGAVTATAYDQLRYLKNKDVYVYSDKRASDVVRMIAADYKLRLGKISQTAYVIPSRVEDNVPLIDIIGNALDLELQHKGVAYTLFDDFGELSLLGANEMYSGVVIDADTAADYTYTSSAENRFNRVKLELPGGKSWKREIFIAEDAKSEDEIGILQYYAKITGKEAGGEKSRALLNLLNRDKRAFCANGVFGDSGVRGGSSVEVDLGGVKSRATVKKCVHRFFANAHLMDLELEDV